MKKSLRLIDNYIEIMKKFLALTLIGSSLILGSNPAKADWDTYGISLDGTSSITIKKCDSSTGSCDSGVTRTSSYIDVTTSRSWIDDENNFILFLSEARNHGDPSTSKLENRL